MRANVKLRTKQALATQWVWLKKFNDNPVIAI
jgi:hypothetical protein